MHEYDTIIIGGGPAGLSAALYASRADLKTMVLETGALGGQIATTSEVENYPGSIQHCTGPTLTERMKEQSLSFGTDIKFEAYQEMTKVGDYFLIRTDQGEYKSKTVIIATGSRPKLIGCKGEQEFRGLGVSYCATCDANFFRGLNVAVVGGGDSAVDEGLFLTKFAKKVILIHRRDELRAAKALQNKAFANPKMDFIWNSTIEEIKGNGVVQSMITKDVKTHEVKEIPIDGVFVFIGYTPNSKEFQDFVALDNAGNVITDEEMKTKTPGVFAAGDIRKKLLKQAITASADGAIAAISAEKYIANYFE
ncbi:MAG: thioredoxin-disulfide reductase [Eubacteriales bacterium]